MNFKNIARAICPVSQKARERRYPTHAQMSHELRCSALLFEFLTTKLYKVLRQIYQIVVRFVLSNNYAGRLAEMLGFNENLIYNANKTSKRECIVTAYLFLELRINCICRCYLWPERTVLIAGDISVERLGQSWFFFSVITLILGS